MERGKEGHDDGHTGVVAGGEVLNEEKNWSGRGRRGATGLRCIRPAQQAHPCDPHSHAM